MKILVVDRDDVSVRLISAKLAPLGHDIVHEPGKTEAVERARAEKFDLIFLDPSPLTNARSTLMNIRRAARKYPYIFMMSDNAGIEDALKSGANNIFVKPFDPANLARSLECAETILQLVEHIGDASEDFPSAGGVIAKSAFNQLFLSALDRGDRYGESTSIIFISLQNYAEIKKLDGVRAAEHASALLSRNLVRLRRQSDIIGQTGPAEFALLLQRPQYPQEPVEAANRFAQALAKLTDMGESGAAEIILSVRLIDIPTGQIGAQHSIALPLPAGLKSGD